MTASLACIAFALAGCGTTATVEQARLAKEAEGPGTSLLALADRMAASGHHAAAVSLYRQAYNEGGGAGLAGLAQSLIALGRYPEAEEVLLGGADTYRDNAEIQLGLGEVNLAFGRPELALANYERAAAGGSPARAHSGRGVALDALGRHEDALRAHEAAVRLGRGDLNVRANQALSLALYGDGKEAVRILEDVVENRGAEVQHRQNLALAYVFTGQEDKAARLAAVDLDPESVRSTIIYFRELATLEPVDRVRALVYGAQRPERNLSDAAILVFDEGPDKLAAASRVIREPVAPPPPPPEPAPEPEPEPRPEPEPEPKPEPEGLPPLVDPQGWSVQIAAYRTAEQLIRGRDIYWERYGSILSPFEPRRSEVDFGDRADPPRGFFYRLNAGPLRDLEQARSICDELKAVDAPCWVRPPEPAEGTLPPSPGD